MSPNRYQQVPSIWAPNRAANLGREKRWSADGINTGNTGYIFEGAVTVSLLALLLDSTVATAGLWLGPEGLT